MMDKLGADHTFVLKLLEDGKMDAQTLSEATFRTRSVIQRIINELLEKGLLEKEWVESQFYYKRK